MCGRFVLITDLNSIRDTFDIPDASCDYQSGWNISPGQLIPAVIDNGGGMKLVCFRWGLISSWSKDYSDGNPLINARGETVDQKPSFREAFRKRRCLIPADGFYEWKKEDRGRVPVYYHLKSGLTFGFAGLYETRLTPDQKKIQTCAIITTAANELIAPVHNRMPVILSSEQGRIWLKSGETDLSKLKSFLKPYPAREMDSKRGLGPHDVHQQSKAPDT